MIEKANLGQELAIWGIATDWIKGHENAEKETVYGTTKCKYDVSALEF